MRSLICFFVAVLLAVAAPAAAQITPTFTFVSGTIINPAEVNANFALLANALNRTGGTMTGTLTTRAVVPDGDNTRDLGSAAASWKDAYFDGVVTIANAGLRVLDTNASHTLALTPGSNLTANRTLTLTTGDADRTVTIGGNPTISQDYSTSGTPQFERISLGIAPSSLYGLYLGAALSGATPQGARVVPSLAPAAGTNAAGIALAADFTEAGSGTHTLLAGLELAAGTVTAAAATVTDTATLYIAGPMSATVAGANYALWIDDGAARLDGTLAVTGAATLSGTINAIGRTQWTGGLDADVTPLTLTCDSATEDTPAIGNAPMVRFTTSGGGNCILKGATAPSLGTGAHVVWIMNATGQAIVLNSQDASEGTAANRFANAGAVGLAADDGGFFLYDRTSSRWRPVR